MYVHTIFRVGREIDDDLFIRTVPRKKIKRSFILDRTFEMKIQMTKRA